MPTSYDYNWCENTAQGQTKTGPQVTRASAKTNRPTSTPTVYTILYNMVLNHFSSRTLAPKAWAARFRNLFLQRQKGVSVV